MTSLALTKVYFSVSHVQIFRRILKDTWFEVLSKFNGYYFIVCKVLES